MQYLANWRMQVAAGLLRTTTSTVLSIAREVGYESEAAFTKAFKRLVGMPPSAWRRKTMLSASDSTLHQSASAPEVTSA
jgi:AraC-like DNA-binding protein